MQSFRRLWPPWTGTQYYAYYTVVLSSVTSHITRTARIVTNEDKLFADDVKLYSRIECEFRSPVSLTLQKIQQWSNSWQLRINPVKSSLLKLGRFKTNSVYDINDVRIPEVQSVKDLGLKYDADLKFDDYISNITGRAYQRIGLIFRGFVSRNPDLLTRAFVTYVRPILEYSTCVWSPYTLKDIRKLENVQRYFTRRLFPESSYSYNERLNILGIKSLECRRLEYDIKMYFKIIHRHTNLDPNKFFLFMDRNGVTRGHNLKIRKHLFHSNRLFNSFCNRAVDCWNSLPDNLVAAGSYGAFCRGITKIDLSGFARGL